MLPRHHDARKNDSQKEDPSHFALPGRSFEYNHVVVLHGKSSLALAFVSIGEFISVKEQDLTPTTEVL